MNTQKHWEAVYREKQPQQWSWFRPHLERSLRWIEQVVPDATASIIDAGAGASTLVDDLLQRGYRNLTVLDISQGALDLSRARLAAHASDSIQWMYADVTEAPLPARAYDLWHDRAVFHFLTAETARQAYVRNLMASLRAEGHAILSTFGPDGPAKCSGLDVVRYDAASLTAELGPRFELVESMLEIHETPAGKTQQFLYCLFQLLHPSRQTKLPSRDGYHPI